MRPRRSVLFVPASNPRAVEKARGSEADCVVLDLEDMVPPDDKSAARDALAGALGGDWGGRERIIRVNGLDTRWGRDDIAAAAALGADALLVPKIETVGQVGEYLGLIDASCGEGVSLWLLAETPRVMLALDAIAGASGRLTTIVMGTQDLIKALGIRPDDDRVGLAPMLSHAVVVARAHGLAAIDGVFLGVKDEDGLARICRQGAAFGFDGKALIHPAQVAAANEAFTRPDAPSSYK